MDSEVKRGGRGRPKWEQKGQIKYHTNLTE